MLRNHPIIGDSIIRGRRGFTLVEVLVVIAIIASLAVPSQICIFTAPTAQKDISRLKTIQQAAFGYAQKKARFPFSTKSNARAHDHVNVLLKSSYREGLHPDFWLSVGGDQVEQTDVDEAGRYVLDEDNLSYTWAGRVLESNSNAVLSCHKFVDGFVDENGKIRSGYKNKIAVALANGTILWVDTEDEDDVNEWKIDPKSLLPKGVIR
jgi:prepilin-type N-terminal cleavage/methylation domain-containing protein